MKIVDKPADQVFFISDTHFGHDWMINFNNRPYVDSEEMDSAMIENWNRTVPAEGLVFVLGDIGDTDQKRIIEVFNQLHGEKILIRGNHENIYHEESLQSIFSEIYDLLYVRIQDDIDDKSQDIVLCHYPMFDWDNYFQGSWQLFGHLHTRELPEFKTLKSKLFAEQYDVGVENNNYRPISYYEVKKIINQQKQDKSFKQSNYY